MISLFRKEVFARKKDRKRAYAMAEALETGLALAPWPTIYKEFESIQGSPLYFLQAEVCALALIARPCAVLVLICDVLHSYTSWESKEVVRTMLSPVQLYCCR